MSNLDKDLRNDSNQARILFNSALISERVKMRQEGLISPKHVDHLPKSYKSKKITMDESNLDEW